MVPPAPTIPICLGTLADTQRSRMIEALKAFAHAPLDARIHLVRGTSLDYVEEHEIRAWRRSLLRVATDTQFERLMATDPEVCS